MKRKETKERGEHPKAAADQKDGGGEQQKTPLRAEGAGSKGEERSDQKNCWRKRESFHCQSAEERSLGD